MSAYALLNRIRLSASDAVLEQAEHILVWITEQYFSPNLSPEDMRALIHSLGNDPLKPFAAACRDELNSIHSLHGDLVPAHLLKAK